MKVFIKYILFLVLSTAVLSCNDTPPPDPIPKDILVELQEMDGVTVEVIQSSDHFQRIFEIRLEQPIDHRNPGGPTFQQLIFLGHVSLNSPVIFETEGYARASHRTRELAPIFDANQLAVEHRFFGESVPNPRNWTDLDIWQAANDHHRVVEIFKQFYPGSWVSSGSSKGGDAAIFHRRFFPDDVDATVAYVTPILFAQEDERYLEYYNTVGNSECRDKLKAYQRAILTKLDSIPAYFDSYVKEVAMGSTHPAFQYSLDYRAIVYHAIRQDYIFEFWSSETEDCTTIPSADASAAELFEHFRNVFDVFLFFSDWGVEFWTPYAYQALTELGNYAYDVSHLTDLERPIPDLVEFEVSTDFDPTVMADIQNWVATEAGQIVFIYGEDDPWTVAAFDHPGSDDVIKIVHPGTKHQTRLETLTEADRQFVLAKLDEWMN